MPNEKGQKDKQRSTKHAYKTKDWVTRTPLKPACEPRCSGRVNSSCSTLYIALSILLGADTKENNQVLELNQISQYYVHKLKKTDFLSLLDRKVSGHVGLLPMVW